MRKTLTIAAAVVALSILGACSSGGSEDGAKDTTTTVEQKATTTTEAGVAVEDWAKTFCTSMGTWLTDIKEASDAVGKEAKVGDVASLKTAVGGLYGTMSSATKTLIEAVSDQGPPAIEDGEAFQAALLGTFRDVDQAALDVQEEIASTPAEDIATFQDKIEQLGTAYQAEVTDVSKKITELGTKYPDGDLSAAIESSCML